MAKERGDEMTELFKRHNEHPRATSFYCAFCGDRVKQFPAESKEFTGNKICCEYAFQEALTLYLVRA